MAAALARAIAIVAVAAGLASAQPAAQALHDANQAAVAGDWSRVDALVTPLLASQLSPANVAEAHRLAGLAAFFRDRRAEAEAHFVAYLRIDHDARLDPALVPPEAVTFFDDVRARHAAELRALRPRSHPSLVLELLPPVGQFANGERTKAWVLTGVLGTLAITSGVTYGVLRSWCSTTDKTCGSHTHQASTLRAINLASAAAIVLTYAYGVYDGVVTYRRLSAAPFVTVTSSGGVAGLAGRF